MHATALFALLPLLAASVDARPRPAPTPAPAAARQEFNVEYANHPQYEPAFSIQEMYKRRLAETPLDSTPSVSLDDASETASETVLETASETTIETSLETPFITGLETASETVSVTATPSASTKSSGGSWWNKHFGHKSAAASSSVTASGKKHKSSATASLTEPASPETTTIAAASDEPITPDDGSFEEYILQLHNGFRAEYGAGNLTYNSTLASFAQQVADSCVFRHSGSPYGENLAAVSGHKNPLEGAFDEWADEAKYYSWEQPGYTESSGHFSQLVWKDTTEVGCGIATCGPDTIFDNVAQNSTFLVCEYYTRGNIIMRGDPGAYFRLNVGTKVANSTDIQV